jgi:glycosyltransferase 2 family protein
MTPALQLAWTWFKRIAPWALAALVLTLVARQARTVEWPEVWRALQALSLAQMLAAAGLALVSYGLVASFDLVGRRLTGHPLTVPRTLGIAAICYAFNLNFGALVGGFGLRLRLYLRGGLSAPTVVQVITHSMVTNWLGYLWVAGAVLLIAPPRLPASWALDALWLRGIGGLMVVLALVYLVACTASRHRELAWRGHTLALPGARLAWLQAFLGGASWLLIGAIAWSLFGGRVDYPTVLGALLLAAVAGVITHVPAGLGVLEAVLVAALAHALPATEVLATVLAYRAAYYLFPLALALPAYAWSEAGAPPRVASSLAQPRPTNGI